MGWPGLSYVRYCLKYEIPPGHLSSFLDFGSFFSSAACNRPRWCVFSLSSYLLNSHESQIVLSSSFWVTDKRTAQVKTLFQVNRKSIFMMMAMG